MTLVFIKCYMFRHDRVITELLKYVKGHNIWSFKKSFFYNKIAVLECILITLVGLIHEAVLECILITLVGLIHEAVLECILITLVALIHEAVLECILITLVGLIHEVQWDVIR